MLAYAKSMKFSPQPEGATQVATNQPFSEWVAKAKRF